ncbi:MAG: transketolase [Lachnospiraceae bacterium]|nr:transketolase [Lachnospiraceae bacterium]
MNFNKKEMDLLAVQIRKNILRAIASKGAGHVGGSLSIADTLAVLYGCVMNIDPKHPDKKDRDYIVISKGHSGPAMYAALAAKGYFGEDVLDTLNKNNTILPSHTDRMKTPGVDMTTGSLGQGTSLASGAALADRLNGSSNYTYLIVGDGELDEGQVWEAALFTAHHHLTNLITFVDANGKQLDGTTDQVCCLGSIEQKFEAFGFHAITVEDGHNTLQIYNAIMEAQQEKEKPSVIVLHTIKGAGIKKYMEMDNCHSTTVKMEELSGFYAELDHQGEMA